MYASQYPEVPISLPPSFCFPECSYVCFICNILGFQLSLEERVGKTMSELSPSTRSVNPVSFYKITGLDLRVYFLGHSSLFSPVPCSTCHIMADFVG